MDRRAAIEYHAVLLEIIEKTKKSSTCAWWIPVLGVSAYFAFDGYAAAVFGALVGWGICAVLTSNADTRAEKTLVEYLRHLHEHTDEAEDGKRMAKSRQAINQATKRWWQ
jgi:hypothetical protein